MHIPAKLRMEQQRVADRVVVLTYVVGFVGFDGFSAVGAVDVDDDRAAAILVTQFDGVGGRHPVFPKAK